VLGKYFGALAFYVFLWLPTVAYVVLVDRYVDVDWGPIAASYLGIFGLGAVFLAAGLFASATTRNQIVAAVLAFALLFVLFIPSFLDMLVNNPVLKEIVSYTNLYQHMDDFSRGVVDTRPLVFYITTSALFLFLATRALETRTWR
jgi:ABC-2 type transport system permease protein